MFFNLEIHKIERELGMSLECVTQPLCLHV